MYKHIATAALAMTFTTAVKIEGDDSYDVGPLRNPGAFNFLDKVGDGYIDYRDMEDMQNE